MQSKQVKREKAMALTAKRNSISHVRQLRELDERLGVGVGAAKERARLAKLIADAG